MKHPALDGDERDLRVGDWIETDDGWIVGPVTCVHIGCFDVTDRRVFYDNNVARILGPRETDNGVLQAVRVEGPESTRNALHRLELSSDRPEDNGEDYDCVAYFVKPKSAHHPYTDTLAEAVEAGTVSLPTGAKWLAHDISRSSIVVFTHRPDRDIDHLQRPTWVLSDEDKDEGSALRLSPEFFPLPSPGTIPTDVAIDLDEVRRMS